MEKKNKIRYELSYHKLTFCQKAYLCFKRLCDFLIGLFFLVLLSPLFIFLAVAIKIDSKGKTIFKQKRLGKGGKLFDCYKFRSMSEEAPAYVGTCSIDSDKYITKVGKFIRKTSLDELPQLLCLVTGKMSLIGFRPCIENEDILDKRRSELGVYQIRPGITGWAQVNGRDVLGSNQKLKAEYDAYYVKHLSLFLDIKIFFLTIASVFSRKGIVEGHNSLEAKNTDN